MKAILAIGIDYSLGSRNGIPWEKHTSDMKYFKEYTTGEKCIVGRKTFEGLGKLPNREMFVVTRNPELYESEEGVHYIGIEDVPSDGVVIGGKELYKELIPLCEEVSITMIDWKDEEQTTDVFFNPFPFVEVPVHKISALEKREGEPRAEVFLFKEK